MAAGMMTLPFTSPIIALSLVHIPRVSAFQSRAVRRVILILPFICLIPSARAQQSSPDQTMPTVITCTSQRGERQVCKADTTAGGCVVALHWSIQLPPWQQLGL